MSQSAVFPTKGNLLATKKSLALATMGFELMDKKRHILIREMMGLISQASALRDEIGATFQQAYQSLQQANVTMGLIRPYTLDVPVEEGLSMSQRSVMGVDLPILHLEEQPLAPTYGMIQTNSALDMAVVNFHRVKRLTVTLAEIENSVYRLSVAIKKTQKRANALKNIIIPRFEETQKFISDALEEKEREEFSRLKVIKRTKGAKS